MEFVLTVDIFGDFVYIYSMSLTLTMPGTEQKNARNTALCIIHEIFIRKNIKIEKIIIFGSRARGDFNKDSDWDFLVIADKEIAIKEKHRLIIQIKRKLAKLGIPNDIIIQSMSEFETMKRFEKIPEILKEEIFEKAFHVAEIANFTQEQLTQYEKSLKVYRDLKGVVDTSYEEGKNEGKIEGRDERNIEIALKMMKRGESAEKISEYTDLSIEEINQLKPSE